VRLDLKVDLATLVILDQLVLKVFKVIRAVKVIQETLVQLARKVDWVTLVIPVRLDLKVD
jgi:hypothetical protein